MKLIDFIKKNNLTVETVASDAGVTVQSIYKYLNGERIPNRRIMAWLVNYSNGQVTPNDFYDDLPLQKEAAADEVVGEDYPTMRQQGENINNQTLA